MKVDVEGKKALLELLRRWAADDALAFDERTGWFRLTLLAVRDGDGWEIANLHLSPSKRGRSASRLS